MCSTSPNQAVPTVLEIVQKTISHRTEGLQEKLQFQELLILCQYKEISSILHKQAVTALLKIVKKNYTSERKVAGKT
jgi:hypothetical protein